LLRSLSRRLTVVLVSHDVGFVSTLVRTVLCVNRRVSIHHTSELTGANIAELYGTDVRMVQHQHDHAGRTPHSHGHTH
jgi:zinc transport system ATP-binding protein